MSSYVHALRASDGKLLWWDEIGERALLSLGIEGGAVYVVTIRNVLYALQISNGTVLWHTDIPSD